MRDLRAQSLDVQGGEWVLAAHRSGIVKRRPGSSHHLLGNRDQGPVDRGVPRSFALALPACHALYLVHAPVRRTRAIAKARDAPQLQCLGEPADQPRQDAHHVPSWEMLRAFQPESKFNDLSDWHFAEMAAALGGHGVRVATRGALARALDDAAGRRGLFSLIEVMLPRGAISDTLSRFVRGFSELRARLEK